MRSPRLALALALAAVSLGAGCGPDPRLMAADDALRASIDASDQAEATLDQAAVEHGPERVSAARSRHARALGRIDEAHEVLRIWRETGTGALSWSVTAPCLSLALTNLRMLMMRAELSVPEALPQAELMTAEVDGNECESEPPVADDEGVPPEGEGDSAEEPEPSDQPEPSEAALSPR